MQTNLQEIWLPIAEYESYYEISNLDRIKSLNRVINGVLFKGRILRPKLDKDNYLSYELNKDSLPNWVRVHILVASHFIDNPDNKECVNHLDGVTFHNFSHNLEWATVQENLDHSYFHGNRLHPGSRRIDQFDLNGNFIKRWDFINDIIKSGVASKPGEVARGQRKQSGGFVWAYADPTPEKLI